MLYEAPPIRPRRAIRGISAVIVPYSSDGRIDWGRLEAHIGRTVAAGLTPAVNMDTGYVQLLGAEERLRVLGLAQRTTGGAFVAGAYVADAEGAPFDLDAHLAAAEEVAAHGGTPVVFPSWGLHSEGEGGWVDALAAIGSRLEEFIGFELGSMFVPYGSILSLQSYRALLDIPQCSGAKHSSLERAPEWDRLRLRDEVRPDFAVYTGNDLAIDMVMWGSDYLLGLSTFAPEAFAARDRLWQAGDARFHEVNDVLQYLGQFAFRRPVPAYRHDAAMFLHLRGWAESDITPPGVPRRPDGDREVLRDIAQRLEGIR